MFKVTNFPMFFNITWTKEPKTPETNRLMSFPRDCINRRLSIILFVVLLHIKRMRKQILILILNSKGLGQEFHESLSHIFKNHQQRKLHMSIYKNSIIFCPGLRWISLNNSTVVSLTGFSLVRVD